ncbi:MAG: TIGR01777 family oxidoreductase [Pseudomonadota bacterium]|uniref:TIGR01777 family oxidoreductase n=1 Tax=Gallaecimonas pentaromativorans TaxID=584787 RepID=UPI00067ED19F|nr:TIGR01777 family oxidoreductase [Gallaecimonas pentaromativorans]MED5524218.1 TIGR01777 family oxidoreductase [Pseudomonadota bacterium]
MTKDRLFITGATGFIGKALCQQLKDRFAITALVRDQDKARQLLGPEVELCANVPDLSGVQVVINLAGEPIAAKRWSEHQKKRITQSRWQLTEELVTAMSASPPRVFISGSAIGFYGPQDPDTLVTESYTAISDDFGHRLCKGWEERALKAQEFTRVCVLRTGVVIGQGGALERMLLPFKLGLGGPVGSGRQIMSWISHHDMVAAILFLLERSDLSGAFNCTAPTPVSSRDFAKTLGAVLGRPALLPMPAFVPKLLLGEGATLLLDGQKVLPKRLLEAGFEFRYPELAEAFKAALG